jgi:Flp pilus assembly pilin Flp
MAKLIFSFLKDQRGVSAIEYAFIGSIIALLLIAYAMLLGHPEPRGPVD